MRYTLLLHYPEMSAETIGAEAIEEGKAEFHAYAEALDQARVLKSAEVLQPVANTTTLTFTNGSLHVQDGPFADTREQLGGCRRLAAPGSCHTSPLQIAVSAICRMAPGLDASPHSRYM